MMIVIKNKPLMAALRSLTNMVPFYLRASLAEVPRFSQSASFFVVPLLPKCHVHRRAAGMSSGGLLIARSIQSASLCKTLSFSGSFNIS